MKTIKISQVPPASQATLLNNQQGSNPQQNFSKLLPTSGEPINRNVVGQILNKLKIDVNNFSSNLGKLSDTDILAQINAIENRVQTILWSIQSGTKKTNIGNQRVLDQTRTLEKQDFNKT